MPTVPNFYASLRAAHEGCSNIIFTETPDGPLLGKNNDLPVGEEKHAGACLVATAMQTGAPQKQAGLRSNAKLCRMAVRLEN